MHFTLDAVQWKVLDINDVSEQVTDSFRIFSNSCLISKPLKAVSSKLDQSKIKISVVFFQFCQLVELTKLNSTENIDLIYVLHYRHKQKEHHDFTALK